MQTDFLSRIKEYRVTKDPSVLPDVTEADRLDDELEDIARELSESASEESESDSIGESFEATVRPPKARRPPADSFSEFLVSMPPPRSASSPAPLPIPALISSDRLEDYVPEKSQPRTAELPAPDSESSAPVMEEPSPARRSSLDSETSPQGRRRKRLDTFVVVADAISAVASPPPVAEVPSFGHVMKQVVEDEHLVEAEIESSAPETFDEPPPTYRTNDGLKREEKVDVIPDKVLIQEESVHDLVEEKPMSVKEQVSGEKKGLPPTLVETAIQAEDMLTYVSPTPPGSPPPMSPPKPVRNLAEFLSPKTVIEAPPDPPVFGTKTEGPVIVGVEPQKSAIGKLQDLLLGRPHDESKSDFKNADSAKGDELKPKEASPKSRTEGLVFGKSKIQPTPVTQKVVFMESDQSVVSPRVDKPRSPSRQREQSPLHRSNTRRKSAGMDPSKFWRHIRAEREGVESILNKISEIRNVQERIRMDFVELKVRSAGITGEYLFRRRSVKRDDVEPSGNAIEPVQNPSDDQNDTGEHNNVSEEKPEEKTIGNEEIKPQESSSLQSMLSAWIPGLSTPPSAAVTESLPEAVFPSNSSSRRSRSAEKPCVPEDAKIFGQPVTPGSNDEEITELGQSQIDQLVPPAKLVWAVAVIQKWFRRWQRLRKEKMANLATMAEIENVAAREALRRRRRERRGGNNVESYSVSPKRVLDDSLDGVEVVD